MELQKQKLLKKATFDELQKVPELRGNFGISANEEHVLIYVEPGLAHLVNQKMQDFLFQLNGEEGGFLPIPFRVVCDTPIPVHVPPPEPWKQAAPPPAHEFKESVPTPAASSNKNLREQAVEHARAAARLLAQAGCKEDLLDIITKEQDVLLDGMFDDDTWETEYFNCPVCNEDHNMTFMVKKPKARCHQYWISIEVETKYHDWSFWERVKALGRSFKYLFITKKETNDFFIGYEDVPKFKDTINRIPLP